MLVDVKAAGVNPVDTYIRRRHLRVAAAAAVHARAPMRAGVVEAVGSDVRGVKPGDRVYISGTADGRASGAYAEKALCNVDQVHHSAART